MSSTQAQKLRRRPSRTTPATITALVLLLVGVGLAWLGMAALTGNAAPTESALTTTSSVTWGSTALYAAAAVFAVIGTVLLLAAVLPGRRTHLTAGTTWDGTDGTTTVISRAAVERFAAARAEQMDGVSSARSSLSGGRLKLSLTTYLMSTADLQRTVREVVQSSVDDLGLKPAPRVSTTARTDHDD